MLNYFLNRIDFSVKIVKLFHFAYMQEELKVFIDDTRLTVSFFCPLSIAVVFALDILANQLK